MVKRIGSCILALAGVLIAPVVAADGAPAPLDRPVVRAVSEVAVEGVTPEDFLARQRELHVWLVSQMPRGAADTLVSVTLTDEDRADLEAGSSQTPMRVGVVKSLAPALAFTPAETLGRKAGSARGSLRGKAPNGDSEWVTTVTSPGAVALRVHFTDVSIPQGAELYFFNDKGEAYGPYVGAGPNGTGEFWSNSVIGDQGTVMLRGAHLSRASLKITEVAHVAIDFPRPASEGGVSSFCSFNAGCIENNSCVNEPAVNDAEGAVAKMRWISGAFVYICSGGLLADTDGSSQIPYFLTANHCLSSDSDASNLEAYFQYSISCGSTACSGSFDPAPSPSTLGATVAATGSAGDFSLLILSETPPAGSVFTGWNNAAVSNSNGADLHRVSHPSGAPQAYSHHQVDTGSPECTGWPRGERIYSVDVLGATEGGSSGSPVVNAAGEVVGQLSGCCGYDCGTICAPAGTNWTVDGALAFYWDSVSAFLDPPVGCTTNAECDDGLFCTGTETCVSGSCQSSGNPCTGGDTCNEATDTCDPPVCNNNGTCEAGEDCNNCPNDCISLTTGAPSGRYCCGDGTCEGAEDSSNCAIDCGGGGCTSDPECDDGDACNGLETCDLGSGTCQAGTPVDCGDGDACTTDSCDSATGLCSNDPINCDDGDACTADSCDTATGCVNVWEACGLADGCCGPDCDSTNDPDCESCGLLGDYCTSGADCCSGSCHPAKDYCR